MKIPFNDYTDLFPTLDEQKRFLSTPDIWRTRQVSKALKARQEIEPDYEVYLPFTYFKLITKKKILNPSFFSDFMWISNKGTLLKYVNKEFTVTVGNSSPGGYMQHHVVGGIGTFMLHRAVACAFVEVPEKHLDKDVCTLEVNHINGKRLISNTTNLEWVTSIENIEHENINDLRPKGINHVKIKPVKGVLNRGKYKGFTFVVIGRTKLVDLGFDQPAVSNCIKGITKSHKNVSWSFATLDEIQSLTKEIPNNIKDFILNVDGNSRWEYIGKCNKTDRVISLIGKANVKAAGFSPSYLDNMFMTQNRYHRGYNWTRKEL